MAVKKKYRFATDLIFEAKEEKQIREMDETDYCYYSKKIDLQRMVRDNRQYEQKIVEIPYTSLESYDKARKLLSL